MRHVSRKRRPLTIANVGKHAVFKVTRGSEPHLVGGLTPRGVYQVLTAKSDYGRSVKIADLAGLTVEGTTRTYHTILDIPMAQAKLIEVYVLP